MSKERLNKYKGQVDDLYMGSGSVIQGKDMWVYSTGGLKLFKDGRFYAMPPFIVDGKVAFVSSMTQDSKGELFFLLNKRSLVICSKQTSPKGSSPVQLEQKEFIPNNKLGGQIYNKLFVDSKNNVWICGREKGLYLLCADKSSNHYLVDSFGAGALSSGWVNDVAQDDSGRLWIGTAAGLDEMIFTNNTRLIIRIYMAVSYVANTYFL